ncbi:MAG TPA: VWA domain-containing protein, partial [Pyrinomonadaceae bacterium]|nr:VWA domain-containing protein [Pyrinomonadaceae bacterium]
RIISFLSLLFFAVAGADAQTATPTPARTPVIAEEDQVVKVESRLIVVPVSVTDAEGEAVKGLKASDFRISEENRPQIIDTVGNAENVPLEIALLIDVSGSVNPLFEFEKKAAAQFLQTVMKPEDRATIFLIGDKPSAVLQSENSTLAAARLQSVVPSGKFTAFYDTVSAASRYLRQNAPVKSLRVIVALTDGEDNWSNLVRDAEKATYRDVDVSSLTPEKRNQLAATTDNAHRSAQTAISRELQDADTVFYVINPGGTSIKLNKISMRAQTGMEKFANETGGTFFLPSFYPTGTKDTLQNASNQKKNEATLDRIFKQLANDLRAQYLVQYYSESDFPTNKFVKLAVSLQNPGNSKIRARQGYYVKK